MFAQRLTSDESPLANGTLVTKLASVVLHVIAQLDGGGERFVALFTLERTIFAMDKLDVLLQLIGFRVAFRAEHADVRPVIGMDAAMMLL